MRPLFLLVALLLAVAGPPGVSAPAAAQSAIPPERPDTAVTRPGPEYAAGPLHRALLGEGWRDLWTLPVAAPIFDFDEYAGGVDWTRRGGGNMSITLHLEAEDGWREYIFRSVDKFPEQAMPSEVRGTLAGWMIEDLTSAFFPAAPLLVPPLEEAVGLLHVEPELRLMPGDPRLEVYQDTFAGMLGTVHLQPNEAPGDEPGFAGSRKIKGTEEFLEDLEESKAHRLDERAFLAARLLDFLINDPDRTQDNFRWARFGEPGDYRWVPLPIDRDWAFVDAGGWLTTLLQAAYPKLVDFGPDFPSLGALTYSTHVLDRRLLQRLTRSDFADVAARVSGAITDDVIAASIALMPPEWRATDAPARIREALRSRRQSLPELALEFYEQLAEVVDIRATDEPDRVTVHRLEDGRVRVRIGDPEDEAADDADRDVAFYDRTFLPTETSEVRIYLHGGDDVARVTGSPTDAITVRIVGGGSDDRLADEAGGGATALYDARGDNRFRTTRGTRVSRRPWDAPEPTEGLRIGSAWAPDWGGGFGWTGTIDYGDASGVVVGVGPSWTEYGFRRLPYHWTLSARALYGFGAGAVGAEVSGDYWFENSPLGLTLTARAVPFHDVRFNGYGNDSPALDDSGLMEQDRIAVEPAAVWRIGWRARETDETLVGGDGPAVADTVRPLVGRLEAGPIFLWTRADPAPDAPIAALPADDGDFTGLGARVAVRLDRTDRNAAPRRGWALEGETTAFPATARDGDAFASARGQAAAYLPLIPGATHIALRAGGDIVTEGAPAQHSAWVGGRTTLRGYRWQRFRGDAAAFASAELRVPLTKVELLLRWDLGVFGLADAGRVWFDGESPGEWHTSLGGGLWLEAFDRAISVAYAHGEEGRLYLQTSLFY